MKYRVTTRGWVVLGVLLIIIASSLVSLFSKDDIPDNTVDSVSAIEENTSISEEKPNTENSVDTSSNLNEESATEDSTNVEELTTSVEEVDEEVDEENITESSDSTTSYSESEYNDYELTIHFDKNISELNEKYFTSLQQVKLMLDNTESKRLVIEGHINGFPYYNDGSYGLNISLERANKVKIYLLTLGVSEDDIIIINKGSSEQVIKSDDVSKHYLNRRAYLFFEDKEN